MRHADRSVVFAARLCSSALIIFGLRYGQPLLAPIAISGIVGFLLAPVVAAAERRRVPRYPAACIAVGCVFGCTVLLSGVIVGEISRLSTDSPRLKENITHRIDSVLLAAQDTVSSMSRILLHRPALPGSARRTRPSEAPAAALPPALDSSTVAPVVGVLSYLGSAALELILVSFVILILTVFLLVHREDVRDRLLQLVGERRMLLTTRMMSDLVGGVRRYLLLNLAINIVFGASFSLLLALLAVPSPLLWGMLAVFLRFIPYVGIAVAMLPPLICALAIDPGWSTPAMLLGVAVTIDTVLSNFVEPHVYGKGIGVSALAVVLSALFWVWCWGTIGLVVATPFAVLLAVIGRYVPGFEVLSILCSDDAGLEPSLKLYHRLIARDAHGARRILEENNADMSALQLFDAFLLPQLMLVESDAQRRVLSCETYENVLNSVRELTGEREPEAQVALHGSGQRVTIVPARLESEQIVADTLGSSLEKSGVRVTVCSAKTLSGEAIASIEDTKPDVVVLVSIGPWTHATIRYLIKRLAASSNQVPIVCLSASKRTGRMAAQDASLHQPFLPVTGADAAATAVRSLSARSDSSSPHAFAAAEPEAAVMR